MPSEPTATPASVSARELPDYWPIGGWRTSTPEEQGIDSEKLADMLAHIQEQALDIDSVTVIRNGTMVLDATLGLFPPDSKHIIHSCTKSIISALIGIAIDQGYIESVQQPVQDLFPERSVANLTADKEAMTLEHVLMMATGLNCRDSYLYRWRGLNKMRQSPDWVQFVLDLPMAEEPGTRFEYCNSASFLLSAIIQETTGMTALEFARENLFAPLGISDVAWPANPQGINIGWGELRLRPHDMAKIGYLYLNQGMWDGEQVIPSAWIRASTREHISAETLQDGYGYQWWIDASGVYMALGYAGQYIVVLPEKDMVVVFTSDLPENHFFVPNILTESFIIPAAASAEALPPNPDGVARLQALIEEVGQLQVIPQPVPTPPAIAESILGETYVMEQNPIGVRSFSIVRQEGDEMVLRATYEGDVELEVRIGLDGVPRLSPGSWEMPMAYTGGWEGESGFIAELDELGNLTQVRVEYHFEGDNVTATISGDLNMVIQGKRADAP
jgi:CubicO group peptidase (beta-lactamase class C family)